VTLEHLLYLLIPGLLLMLIGSAWRDAKASSQRLGARIGDLEDWKATETGRRLGRAEVLAEQGRKEHGTK